ncbi:MAG: TerC family protein, partial [Actinomycetota bacterium]
APFLVFTSNAFAILGLRALYFLLAGMMDRFRHLKLGLAAVLVFVGAKMLVADVVHIPIWLSLLVIATLIAISVATSVAGRGRSIPTVRSALTAIDRVRSSSPRPSGAIEGRRSFREDV